LLWLDPSQVRSPAFYDSLARGNTSYRGQDITMQVVRDGQRQLADCLVEVIRVGFIDSDTIGCIASDVVLYVSLVFIIGVVAIKFAMAVTFGWFLSWRLGSFRGETIEQRRARAAEIEKWTDNIYSAAPKKYHPNVKNNRKSILPSKSRFSMAPTTLKPPSGTGGGNRQSMYGVAAPGHGYTRSNATSIYGGGKAVGPGMRNSPPGSPGRSGSSSTSLVKDAGSRRSSMSLDGMTSPGAMGFSGCPFPLDNVVPQPSKDFEPFNFPLAHAICLVTAYSESTEGLRTTLDSLATTDYPNSHKLIMVIADGMVKGSGNPMTTPEICLTMMKEFVVPKDEVQPHSYVAIADGHKRHNMAKVYTGFYDYDSTTVESSKQQRVPIVLVAKVGNPLEAHDAKPGNRGKRDSQVLLMAFLQKVIFDERMTTMEYEFFNSIWRCTGVSADQYEVVLMVDADTKVRSVAAGVRRFLKLAYRSSRTR
jgi:chitin synthase